jgi:peptidoglycan/LPS O-acetylase OafA/YrhL
VETEKNHIPALDGIRGVAVLMVMLFHICPGLFRAEDSLFKVVRRMAYIGQLGVDLFFVLSGFLITGILLRSKGSVGYFRNFYIRRILRIFPLYYGFLLVFFFLIPPPYGTAGVPATGQAWYWFFGQNIASTFTQTGTGGPGHFWSLAVEDRVELLDNWARLQAGGRIAPIEPLR